MKRKFANKIEKIINRKTAERACIKSRCLIAFRG
jgi:hypothetical protein